MEIIIAKHAGFCGGVDFAITQAKELLKKEPIYCLGEIVHNEQVIKELEQNGMITVNSIDEIPEYSNVIFRAHGEPISTYQKAEERKLKIQDLTCANVKRIHEKVQEHKKDAFKIALKSNIMLIIGSKNSSNTKKLFEVARENCKIVYAIETVEAIKDIKFNMNDKIGIIAGASTPNYIIDDVKRYLEGVC